jgi:protein phosphatase 1B
MSRALGDYSLDKHIIPPVPDIIQHPRDSSASFLILASDGIWDVMTNEQVAAFVSQRALNTTFDNIISQLFDHCLQQQSTDNMTAFIVKLD